MSELKYIVAREWGFGFWSDMGHILSVLMVAEITGRIPVIHWGNNCLFGDGKHSNAFDFFWQPLNDVDIGDLASTELSFYPEGWDGKKCFSNLPRQSGHAGKTSGEEFLDRDEDVIVSTRSFQLLGLINHIPGNSILSGMSAPEIYRHLWQTHLRPHENIKKQVQDFIEKNLAGPFVAVHARGSDKIIEAGDFLNQANDAYFNIIDRVRENPEWRIFVLTESDILLDRFKDRYGEQVVATECFRTRGDKGIHYLRQVPGNILGREVLIDTLIALQADKFLGNGVSGVSCAIDVFKDWPEGEKALVGRNLWLKA